MKRTTGSAAKTKPTTRRRTAPTTSRKERVASDELRDPSDVARDQRLRDDLQSDSARSAADRHRERLTATEAEEDGITGDDDDERDENQMREQAINEQEFDDERS